MAIDGITVLSTYTQTACYGISAFFLLLAIFGIAFGLGFASVGWLADDSKWCTSGIIVTILGILFAICCYASRTVETHYKVILDDSVSMNEFYQHYKVTNIDGLIYTITPIQEDTN